jgi:hypothetical protein
LSGIAGAIYVDISCPLLIIPVVEQPSHSFLIGLNAIKAKSDKYFYLEPPNERDKKQMGRKEGVE